ncbi:MAG: hypothetical protein ACP5UB_08975 [Candidatus Sumerlaeaceae bacterium]
MRAQWKWKRNVVTVLGISFALAVLVRLPAFQQRSWWIDELITAQVATRPLVGPDLWDPTRKPAESLIGFTIQDTGPGPLAYLMEGLFAKMTKPGGGEFWLRLPGVVAALFFVALTYAFGKSWWGSRRAAATMALLAAAFPPYVDFSMGARGYAWTALLLLVQWHALWKLACKPAARSSKCWSPLGALTLTTVLSFYFTPINLVWCAPAWLAALSLSSQLDALRRPAARKWMLGHLLVAGLLIVPYLVAWISRIAAKATPGGEVSVSRALLRLRDFANEISHEPWFAILICLPPVTLTVVSISRLRHRQPERTLIFMGWGTMFGGGILSAALLTTFFLAPRYLVGFSIPLLWSCGVLLQRALALLRQRWGPTVVASAWLGTSAIIAALELPSAVYYARTPVHDWLSAVKWVSARIGHTDIVFCGPNADIEVLWAYSKVFHWDHQVPRWLILENGRKVDSSTTEALRLALSSNRRLWYITPFFGQVRPQEYWNLLRQHFREVARFPGRGDIHVLLHEPAGSQ